MLMIRFWSTLKAATGIQYPRRIVLGSKAVTIIILPYSVSASSHRNMEMPVFEGIPCRSY